MDTDRRKAILNDLGECSGKAPCHYIVHSDTPQSKCWLKTELSWMDVLSTGLKQHCFLCQLSKEKPLYSW